MRHKRKLPLIAVLMVLSLLLGGCGNQGEGEKNEDFAYVLNDTQEYAVIVRYKGEGAEVVIPDTLGGKPVHEIAATTFLQAPHVTAISIPAGITKIEDPSFYTLPVLQTITVAEGNVGFTVVDGVLFQKRMKTLYCYPQGREGDQYTVPDSVQSIGACAFYGSPLKKIVLPEKLQKIYASGFENAKHLISITLGSQLSKIYESAFAGCAALLTIQLPDGVTSIGRSCFENCTNLEDIVVPEMVASLGDGAFQGCTSLKTADIRSGEIRRIAERTFQGCTSLSSVKMREQLLGVAAQAFKDCTCLESFPYLSSATVIGWEAFRNCKSLSDITLSQDILSIGGKAFDNTPYLADHEGDYLITEGGVLLAYTGSETEVTVPDGVRAVSYISDHAKRVTLPATVISINEGAFSGNAALKRVDAQDGLTTIENEAFMDCVSLEAFLVPASVAKIGQCAFRGCTGIKEYEVHPSNVTYATDKGVLYSIAEKRLIAYPAASDAERYQVIPSTLSIEEGAFEQAAFLEELDAAMCEELTIIQARAFAGCTSLVKVQFHENMRTLGDYAFENCVSLRDYDMNYALVNIGKGTFKNCTSLKKMTLHQPLARIGADALMGIPDLSLTVFPGKLGERYAQAYGIAFVSE